MRVDHYGRYGVLAVIGRFMVALLFVLSGLEKIFAWGSELAFLSSKGMPAAGLFLFAALVIELVGGLMLMFGLKPRFAAAVLFLYLIPVTIVMHDFWNMTGPGMQPMMQDTLAHFFKNISIMGGLLAVIAFESLAAQLGKPRQETFDETLAGTPQPDNTRKTA